MEGVRKFHNDVKRALIREVTRRDEHVLDVGAGFGGDLQKWAQVGARVNMCDPEATALEEAKRRAKSLNLSVNFYHGDIQACPKRKFDVICYNFSLQYVFATEDLFHKSLRGIRDRARLGTRLVGVIPDSDRVLRRTPLKMADGSFFMTKQREAGYGGFGEKLFVYLADTPYYTERGPMSEPVAYKDLLVTHLERLGFRLHAWEPIGGDNEVSQFYSKFIFVYNRR